MTAFHIFLEITLHLCINFQFFLTDPCLFIKIKITQYSTLAITFQIVMDHSVKDEIARNREAEGPFIIDYGHSGILNQNISRHKINIGHAAATTVFTDFCITKDLHEFRCFKEHLTFMDTTDLFDIAEKQLLKLFCLSCFQKFVQSSFQCLSLQVFQTNSIILNCTGIQFQSFSSVKSSQFPGDFFQILHMFYRSFFCR